MNSGCRCKGRRSGKLWWCRGRWINQIELPQEQVWGGGQDTGWKCIHAEGREEKSADCREMISVLTPGTSITFSTATDWPQPKTDLSVCSTGTRGQTLENRDKPQTPSCDTDTDGSAETWFGHNIKTTDRWRELTLIILLWKPRDLAFTWTLLCHVQSLIHGCSSSQPRGSSINVPVSDTEGHPPEGLHPELFRGYKRDEYNRAAGLNAV